MLSPHLDDAVLNCWSVLTSADDQRIVNVFAGVPRRGFVTAWDRACGAVESAAHVRARIAEDWDVLGSIGRRAAYLPFLDAQYRTSHPTVMAIDRAVAEVAPAASLVYAPAALGFAPVDHLLLRAYARALAHQGMPVLLYADLPYAVRAGRWPVWVRSGTEARDAEGAFWRPALRGVPEIVDVEVVTLPPEVASAKLAAMRAYGTQFSGLDHDGRLSDPRTHSHEVFWELRADRVAHRGPTEPRRLRLARAAFLDRLRARRSGKTRRRWYAARAAAGAPRCTESRSKGSGLRA